MSTATAPPKKVNRIGLEVASYKGGKTTLCAGCGHNSISERIIECFYEMGVEPWTVAKFSGIGCSSKSPAYFLNLAHGFNSVHGRAPSIATGALLANRNLFGITVSGDGDTASIGIGQFIHMLRRNVRQVYIIEDNGVYGLTKGQFSATADKGAKSKKGVTNLDEPIDMVAVALQLGATFVGRSFSGDKAQLVPLIKAALEHKGAAFIDCLSPCVTFNNHVGSTKSYDYVREHNEAVNFLDVITGRDEIIAEYEPGTVEVVKTHDGGLLKLRKIADDYDVTDRLAAMNFLQHHHSKGEIVTGLLYVDPDADDLHGYHNTANTPLNALNDAELVPGSAALAKLNASLR
jgi:2-oxoglutarate ferredoxin oxidoreductase subunit beta